MWVLTIKTNRFVGKLEKSIYLLLSHFFILTYLLVLGKARYFLQVAGLNLIFH